jgi:nitrate reductase (cytochrome), electron transfer subunit
MALNRRCILLTAALAFALASSALAQEQQPKPIRGPTPIPETNPSEAFKYDRSDRPIPRNYPEHPPIIPHNIKGYQITKNVNMCMSCHAKTRAPTTGNPLPNISTRRYFCLQCHVPQFNAEPLVPSTFKPAT